MGLKKIDLTKLPEYKRQGVDALDYFRDGRSTDLNSIAVSYVLVAVVQLVNSVVDMMETQERINEDMAQQLEQLAMALRPRYVGSGGSRKGRTNASGKKV